MATPTTINYLGGKAELAIGTNVIDPQFLSDITVTLQEGDRTTTSLAGIIDKPSGSYQTAEITGNFILPSMDAVKLLQADLYQEGVAGGRITFGAEECTEQEPKIINIHYSCENDSRNDFHAYAGLVKADFTMTYNPTDTPVIPFTIKLQPTENGYCYIGAGDLTASKIWDATTQSYVAVPISG